MINKLLFLFFVFTFSACGFFSKKVESLVESSDLKSPPPAKVVKKNLHCANNSRVQLILEDESTIKYYRPTMIPLFESKNFSFIQKAAMLSLIEMSRRPDEASPTSRLQYFLRFNGKVSYFDYLPANSEDYTKMPYLKGIEELLKKFDPTKSLLKLSETMDNVIPQSVNVGPELEAFLQNHKSEMLANEDLAEIFFKGDEVLTRHESFKRISFKKIVSNFYAEKLNNEAFYDTSKNALSNIDSEQTDLNLKCNTDINKDNSLKDELINSSQMKSHYFAFKEGDNFFIAVSSSVMPKKLATIKNSYFILTHPPKLPLPVCQFKTNQEDIVLFSTQGRNPAQHLKHLITYDISTANSYSSLEELLNFSRHLFLIGPDRILYESKRGRKSQLDFFLSMNFPIYHVDTLGDIIGSAGFKNRDYEDRSLIIDDRSPARLWCSP